MKKIERRISPDGTWRNGTWELEMRENLLSQLIVYPQVVTQTNEQSYAPGQGFYGSVEYKVRKSKTSHLMFLTNKGIYSQYLSGPMQGTVFSGGELKYFFGCNVTGTFRKILELQL